MSELFRAVRGMKDVLPDEIPAWALVESACQSMAAQYGYREIRFPVLEKTSLFKRTIGEVTDIVEKEMYTFEDRNGDSLTLRPEGTAVCVRAALEHGLLHQGEQRLWYLGPMFRHERPQKGRFRQFQQFGIEAFGFQEIDIDVEILLLTYRLWKKLQIQDRLVLHMNYIGSADSRAAYKKELVKYFKDHLEVLDEDSLRRLETNPLRILDSKNPALQPVIQRVPALIDYLSEQEQSYFTALQAALTQLKVPFIVNPRLVRGLDYYNALVFEWITEELGAQGTVCAGGRYDTLIEMLGGKLTPAVGFALGIERLVAMLENVPVKYPPPVDVYIVLVGEKVQIAGMEVAEKIRDALPDLKVAVDCSRGNFKNQFKRADKSGAHWALVIGEEEIKNHSVSIKNLREKMDQKTCGLQEVIQFLRSEVC